MICVTCRIIQVTTYVLTKPGREVLFTVISHDEKYKAKVTSLCSTLSRDVAVVHGAIFI